MIATPAACRRNISLNVPSKTPSSEATAIQLPAAHACDCSCPASVLPVRPPVLFCLRPCHLPDGRPAAPADGPAGSFVTVCWMTQTAAQDPFPQQAEGPRHPDQRLPGAPFADDAVPGAPDPGEGAVVVGRRDRSRRNPRGAALVGPGPLRTEPALGRPGPVQREQHVCVAAPDLVLAGLFLLAGCVTGTLVSGTRHDEPTTRTVALAVASRPPVPWLPGAWGFSPANGGGNRRMPRPTPAPPFRSGPTNSSLSGPPPSPLPPSWASSSGKPAPAGETKA